MLSLVAGIAVGYACNQLAGSPAQAKVIASYFSIVTDIFLRMIKMIIAPLVFATIVSALQALGPPAGRWAGSPPARWHGSSRPR